MRSRLLLILAIVLLLGSSMAVLATDFNADGAPDLVACLNAPLVISFSHPDGCSTKVECGVAEAPTTAPPPRAAAAPYRC